MDRNKRCCHSWQRTSAVTTVYCGVKSLGVDVKIVDPSISEWGRCWSEQCGWRWRAVLKLWNQPSRVLSCVVRVSLTSSSEDTQWRWVDAYLAWADPRRCVQFLTSINGRKGRCLVTCCFFLLCTQKSLVRDTSRVYLCALKPWSCTWHIEGLPMCLKPWSRTWHIEGLPMCPKALIRDKGLVFARVTARMRTLNTHGVTQGGTLIAL